MSKAKIILSEAEVAIIMQFLADSDADKSFITRFETVTAQVLTLLSCIDDEMKTIYKESVGVLKEILESYLCGKYSHAYVDFKKLMTEIALQLDYEKLCVGDVLYRARKFDRKKEANRILYSADDMWPVSMEKREKADLHRFGILGNPMLYLGKSEYVCWEELNRPHLDDIVFARVIVKKDFQVLDLRLKRDSEISIATLPLIIACSMYVNDRASSFKEEFIISEMLCRWLNTNYRKEVKEIEEGNRTELKYGGVMYSSTRTFRTMENVSSKNIDYMALPTYIKEDTTDDNTSILKNYLSIKQPYSKGYQCVLNSLDI